MIALPKNMRLERPHQDAPTWQAGFLILLPDILRHARRATRALDQQARDEWVQEIVCNCLVAYQRLYARGKAEVAYAGVLVRFAVAQIRDGRRVGGQLRVRDVLSAHAQKRKGLVIERLNRYVLQDDSWKEIAVEDRRATPAETAAFRIDFAQWMAALAPRQRKIAAMLAGGERTQRVAARFRLSAGRISQLRRDLKDSWEAFQGERKPPVAGEAAA